MPLLLEVLFAVIAAFTVIFLVDAAAGASSGRRLIGSRRGHAMTAELRRQAFAEAIQCLGIMGLVVGLWLPHDGADLPRRAMMAVSLVLGLAGWVALSGMKRRAARRG